MWKLKIHERLKLLLWKIAWDILPTKVVLNRRWPQQDLHCVLCNHSDESIEHILISCPYTSIIWFLSIWLIITASLDHLSPYDIVKYAIFHHKHLQVSLENGYMITLFCSIFFDNIWRISNQTIFANYMPSLRKDANIINRACSEHIAAWTSHLTRPVMMPKIVSEPYDPHMLYTEPAKQKQRRPCREY